CLGRLPDLPRSHLSRGDRGWGALVGGLCGATAAFTVLCVAVVHDEVMPPALVSLIVAGFGAFLGITFGGGALGPTGWSMLAGGLLGWAGVASVAVLLRQDVWGLIDGAILGAPVGLFLGFLFGLERERAGAAGKRHPRQGFCNTSSWSSRTSM